MKKIVRTIGLIFKYVGLIGTILFILFSVLYLLFGTSNNITGTAVFLILACPFVLLFLFGRKLTSESDKVHCTSPLPSSNISSEPTVTETAEVKESAKNSENNFDKAIKRNIKSSGIIKQEKSTVSSEESNKKLREEQALKYAQKITFENNNKEFIDLMTQYISRMIEYISYYYNELNDYDVVIENFLLLAESKEVRFDISLHSGTRTNHIQRTKSALAEYINTKYVRVDFGATENGTIGIIVPMPEYLATLFSNII